MCYYNINGVKFMKLKNFQSFLKKGIDFLISLCYNAFRKGETNDLFNAYRTIKLCEIYRF